MRTVTFDRNELIDSYDFVEELTSTKGFLSELLLIANKSSGIRKAYVSLVDDEYQYILSQHNSSLITTMPANASFCQLTVKQDTVLEIEDTSADPRTRDLPVTKEKNIGYYCGAPLVNHEGQKIGALCLIDTTSNKISQNQKEILKLLANQIVAKIDEQRALIKLIKEINPDFDISTCHDISCLKSLLSHLHHETIQHKESLQETNDNLNIFAASVAHDIKAPLRNIKGFTSILESEMGPTVNSKSKQLFHYINQSTTSLGNLVDDILEFAKTGTVDSSKIGSIPLSKMLSDVTANLEDIIISKKAVINLPDKDIAVIGHKTSLSSLLQNLVSNGLKFQEQESIPIIDITVEDIGKAYMISVTDNGIGIPEKHLADIFKPFNRLHNQSKFSGSGIGLATARKIANSHGSELHIRSKEHEGSTFSFSLLKGE